MHLLFLLLWGLAGPVLPGRCAKPSPDVTLEVLQPGVYAGELRGMLCTACAEALRRQLSGIEGVEKVSVDFEARRFRLTVPEGRKVPVSAIRKALRRAAQKIDLGTEFSLDKLRYAA